MSSLNPARFDEFFLALYGCDPVSVAGAAGPQGGGRPGRRCRLAGSIALPTAAGKTACIDMAVFALACQVDRPPENAPPRTGSSSCGPPRDCGCHLPTGEGPGPPSAGGSNGRGRHPERGGRPTGLAGPRGRAGS